MVLVFLYAPTDQAAYQSHETDPHSTGEETEAAELEGIAQGHLAAERWAFQGCLSHCSHAPPALGDRDWMC